MEFVKGWRDKWSSKYVTSADCLKSLGLEAKHATFLQQIYICASKILTDYKSQITCYKEKRLIEEWKGVWYTDNQ